MCTKKVSEAILYTVLFIAGIALWISAQGIEAGAAMGQGGDFMPKLCAVIWVILSGLLLVTGIFGKGAEEKAAGGNTRAFFMTLALLFFYVLLLKPVGFVITSSLYMFAQMVLFVPKELINKKRLVLFAAISIILPILVNLLFVNVFSLILPAGILK